MHAIALQTWFLPFLKKLKGHNSEPKISLDLINIIAMFLILKR